MTPELSRQVGLILGKASPAPTLDERDIIIQALQIAEEWEDLPDEVIELLDRLQNPALALLPTKSESRALRLSSLNRQIIKDSDKCPLCVANNDPKKVPVHPNCHCNVVTDSVETGVVGSDSRLLDVLRTVDGFVEVEVVNGELPAAVQLNPETVAVFDPNDVRFADLARWLEQMQPYLEASDQYLAIVVDDDSDEALAEVEETLALIAENPDEVLQALQNKKLWFAIGQAVI